MGTFEHVKNTYLAYDAKRRAKYECKVCGAKDLPYTAISTHHYVRFNDGDPSCWISIEGGNGMIVCSEECRKKYIFDGRAPYRSLMKQSWEGDYIIPERHLRDPYCRLSNWSNGDIEQLLKFRDVVNTWIDNPVDGWLFTGPVGSGKTSLACAIAHEFRKSEKRVKFVHGSELMDEIKTQEALRAWDIPKQRQTFFDKYLKNDLLIVDEIISLDWSNMIVGTLITKLHAEAKHVIFTTNLSIGQLEEKLKDQQQLLSRLLQMTKVLAFTGSDFRINSDQGTLISEERS